MTKIETNTLKPSISFNFNDSEYFLIDKDVENSLDTLISELNTFMDENEGKGKSDSEKDGLYKSAQDIYIKYKNELSSTKYNFYLNKEQHNFLNDLVVNKLEYDVNTVFFAIELKSFFDEMKSTKYSSNELICQKVNATEITYIYHLISKHTVKGLSKNSFTFAEILMKIGEISKIFNYYETYSKNLSGDIQDWVTAFEEGVFLEKKTTETVKGEVL
jgi:RecA-family ATPase